jgi:hypothetical protein
MRRNKSKVENERPFFKSVTYNNEGEEKIIFGVEKIGESTFLLREMCEEPVELDIYELLAYLPVLSQKYDVVESWVLDYGVLDEIERGEDDFKSYMTDMESAVWGLLDFLDIFATPGYKALRPYVVATMQQYHSVHLAIGDAVIGTSLKRADAEKKKEGQA